MMAQEERSGQRKLTYSAWHRRRSTQRFVGIEKAQLLSMIDLDVLLYVEYDDDTRDLVGLLEVAEDHGQYKCASVTANLAKRAGIPAFVVLYTVDGAANPAAPEWRDISQFRVKRLWPSPETAWRTLPPQEYAEKLLAMRQWAAGQLDKELLDEQPF